MLPLLLTCAAVLSGCSAGPADSAPPADRPAASGSPGGQEQTDPQVGASPGTTPPSHTDPPVVPDPPVDYERTWPDADWTRVTAAGYPVSTCVPERLDAGVFTLTTEDGVHLSVLEVGSGPRAVVLSHEQGYSICSWVAFAQELADAGYHVMTFDYRNHGASEVSEDNDHIDRDLQVVVDEMHRRGGGSILLGGASCGGTASAVVGARDTERVGLLILSSPAQCGSLDGEAAVATIKEPSYFAVSPGDMAGAVQEEVERLHAASAAADKHLEIDPSGFHGTDMLYDLESKRPTALHDQVRDFVDRVFEQAS